jgi:mannose-6-phosphate isomerase
MTMPDLYPFLMAPHFDRRPWGTRDLEPIYARSVAADEEPIGEAWLTWDQCRVTNGPWGGATLAELCTKFGPELVGTAAPADARFPLLTKFLFPREKLSVQVHPDDETARRLGEACGKTECWYVVQAAPGSRVAVGLKPGTSREEFERAIREQRAEETLDWIDVQAGDMIYVEAGTVHTLGPGPVILEIQQNSNTTFRLYDYGRPRELHIEQGLAAMKEHTGAGKVRPVPCDDYECLIRTPQFVVDKVGLNGESHFAAQTGHSAQVLTAIRGCGIVECEATAPITFACGDAVIIPAALSQYRIKPQWELEFVRAQLP